MPGTTSHIHGKEQVLGKCTLTCRPLLSCEESSNKHAMSQHQHAIQALEVLYARNGNLVEYCLNNNKPGDATTSENAESRRGVASAARRKDTKYV